MLLGVWEVIRFVTPHHNAYKYSYLFTIYLVLSYYLVFVQGLFFVQSLLQYAQEFLLKQTKVKNFKAMTYACLLSATSYICDIFQICIIIG